MGSILSRIKERSGRHDLTWWQCEKGMNVHGRLYKLLHLLLFLLMV